MSVHTLVEFEVVTGELHTFYDAGPVSSESLNAAYKLATVQPRAHSERDLEQKKLTLVRVQGCYAGPDVLKSERDDVAGYAAVPEHTVFGKLLMKGLPEMLAKGVVVGNRYEVLPNGLAEILEGMERLQKGVSGVKLIGHPQDATI
ncbi:hypothetical protein B0H16DRAFT_1729295 [Mycena metata]|uniref:Uncharacterized protein n=1 Tax=Mycena metata TaxID=1033252 RepID=A0AAD7N090_9AGAR|nr:hypothetical protein B0H16DRAFT_1729295 [Mycena metata]